MRQFRDALSEHDPKKWVPVFRKDHAQTISWSATTMRPEIIVF